MPFSFVHFPWGQRLLQRGFRIYKIVFCLESPSGVNPPARLKLSGGKECLSPIALGIRLFSAVTATGNICSLPPAFTLHWDGGSIPFAL